ncbi:MAG: esterase-like activity of phytase family protein, partial [Comamonas sp.]|nr:esterase-like activity of phytase family protein [Comamonas sp.]
MRHFTSSSCLMAATAAAVALLSACADSRPLQVANPETVMQTTGVGSISAVVTRQDVQFDDKFYFPYEGQHPGTKADFPKGFLPAYGSGLALKGRRADGTLEFYAITDRGPNATTGPVTQITDGSNPTGFASSTVFPSPNFTPSIG